MGAIDANAAATGELAAEPSSLSMVRINAPALTAQQSFENDTPEIRQSKQRFTVRQRQQRALEDFFRDTGGKVTDLRVVRSAMFLSDEIDRAVRGLDQENQYVGWRPYNRFYAQGTEELFTNIPTGRSPLVMAAPKATEDTKGGRGGVVHMSEMKKMDDIAPVLPIQYQAVRQSHLKQVGRAVNEIENYERQRLHSPSSRKTGASHQTNSRQFETLQRKGIVKVRNDEQTLQQQRKSSSDLRAGVYQAYEEDV